MTEKTAMSQPRLADDHYVKFRDLVVSHAGLHFPDKKRGDLERGVFKALSKSPQATVDDYFEALAANPADSQMGRLVNFLTVGETYFYRDEGQFQLLKNEILPRLIADRLATTRRLRVWSAGCATGEEPYSLAIVLRELIPYVDTWDVGILGTDINSDSLSKAKSGRYGQWSFRNVPQKWLERYFSTSAERSFHISDQIKQMVSFNYLNLKSDDFPSALNQTMDVDLIVCRNVAIYFDEATTGQVMNRFYDSLLPGGWLLMGASDPIPPNDKFWTRNFSGTFIYQKRSPGADIRRPKQSAAPPLTAAAPVAKRASRPRKAKPQPAKKIDLLAEGQTLLEMGQPALAADRLADFRKENPDTAQSLLLMAKIEVARGDLDQALIMAEQVIGLDKLNIKAYYLLAAIHQSLGADEKAKGCLKKTVYLDKTFIAGHFALGCLFQKENQTKAAEKAFKNVVRLMVGRSKDEVVPECNGITYGKLLHIAEMHLNRRER
jgi:chemotaxis protein methyltransferase CheR